MRITVIFVAVLVIAYVSGHPKLQVPENARELYEEFKRQYKKDYANENDEHRFAIFKDNLLRAQLYQMQELGTAEYGITQFSDLTAEEFAARYLNARVDMPSDAERLTDMYDLPEAPSSFDWREHGAVAPVEDQGQCGSCWAFSTVGNIEGQWFGKTGKLLVLSKQQVVDCDHEDSGCDGGYPPNTYGEIKKFGGLELQADYPYEARDGMCRMNPEKFVAYINGSVVLDKDEGIQATWLAANGPMSTALNAKPLQFYREGIMHPVYCSPAELNHAVLTVGYGEERGKLYWIVKNSWGPSFGEKGYFRIYRGNGTCGINLLASSALIENGAHLPWTVFSRSTQAIFTFAMIFATKFAYKHA